MKIIVFYIIGVFLLYSCSGETVLNESKTGTGGSASESNRIHLSPEQVRNAEIKTGSAEKRRMHLSIQVNGIVDVHPENDISISAPLGGYLKKTDLIPGRKVKKGMVLAILEDQQYIQIQQNYLTAKDKLHLLEADYIRQKGLNESKIASDKIVQQAESEYRTQRILVRSLSEQLKLIGLIPEKLTENNLSRSIAIHAPISGIVSKVNVHIGKYVNPSDVLFELINPEDVCINLTVFENDASKLIIGQKVKIRTNQDVEYVAQIELISPNIDTDRSTQVHAKMHKKTSGLFPGTFVNAAIELTDTDVISVPSEAVVKWENKNYLFIEEKTGTYQMVLIETGNSSEGFTELKSPVPSLKIVIKNAYTLLMKLKNSEE